MFIGMGLILIVLLWSQVPPAARAAVFKQQLFISIAGCLFTLRTYGGVKFGRGMNTLAEERQSTTDEQKQIMETLMIIMDQLYRMEHRFIILNSSLEESNQVAFDALREISKV